jgi:16S rRNA (uracil1498-N3)-methyltransferase
VLRLSVGDHVRIFNGRGEEWDGVLDIVTRHGVHVRLGDSVPPAREPGVRITLATAVLKGDKMDDVVRDAVMLGAAVIEPLVTARTEISRAAIERSGRVERWQRVAVSSAKQCGRAVVPPVHAPRRFDDVIAGLNDAVMLVEPSASHDAVTLRELTPRESLTLVAGPEGGWTESEVRLARANGTMLLTLGAQTLRADALPIVALTACRVRLEDF